MDKISGSKSNWISCFTVLAVSIEFSLNVFTEFAEFGDKKNDYGKRARTCHLLCKRPGCYHNASNTHVRDRIWSPIQYSVVYQNPIESLV